MFGELITLPLRVGVRVTRLWMRATEEAVAVTTNVAGRLIDTVRPDSNGHQPAPASAAPTAEASAPPAAPAPPATPRPTARPRRQPLPQPPQPRSPLTRDTGHVSEEPELVAEVAEPGAESGAGAELHIEEPWEGYRQMQAKEIIARLTASTAAELAAVQLYERSNRGRQTILKAAEREMRSNGGRPN
jgi:hypothetical protein